MQWNSTGLIKVKWKAILFYSTWISHIRLFVQGQTRSSSGVIGQRFMFELKIWAARTRIISSLKVQTFILSWEKWFFFSLGLFPSTVMIRSQDFTSTKNFGTLVRCPPTSVREWKTASHSRAPLSTTFLSLQKGLPAINGRLSNFFIKGSPYSLWLKYRQFVRQILVGEIFNAWFGCAVLS